MNSAKVIKRYLNGLAMKTVMAEKGWNKQEAATHVIGYLTCGKPISPSEYFASLGRVSKRALNTRLPEESPMAQTMESISNSSAPVVPFADMLARIDPKRSPAYSRNLHLWMKSNGRSGDTVYKITAGSTLARIYGDGSYFIGQPYGDYEGDSDFSGALLMQILTMGCQVVRACYTGDAPRMIEVADFWDRYELVGRCVIDPDHKIGFRDNAQRFYFAQGQHCCKWCSSPVASRFPIS
ncbi:hypothetical protein [Pseudomonas syringae]|uniref:hypothetical protein n=1 Tax=Pseudomonas syringae TaxID=317 RepID=UPI001F2A0686|nr:hypothetical protein [Pseudomonas syringae]MCF5371999.1 hypothetical protein [Pseudomonas syringae]